MLLHHIRTHSGDTLISGLHQKRADALCRLCAYDLTPSMVQVSSNREPKDNAGLTIEFQG